jgi:hypothetical protein
MAEYLDLGKVVDPDQFNEWIERTLQFETVVHRYGTEFKIPDYPCWMEYRGEGGLQGYISFTRNTSLDPVLQDMIDTLQVTFKNFFPEGIIPSRERIHLIKTSGCIPVHRDEANRLCCINIGIKNSDAAITRISNDGVYDNFNSNHSEFRVKPGHAYLMNTGQWHSVESSPDTVRYLITYGFGVHYHIIANAFMQKQRNSQYT